MAKAAARSVSAGNSLPYEHWGRYWSGTLLRAAVCAMVKAVARFVSAGNSLPYERWRRDVGGTGALARAAICCCVYGRDAHATGRARYCVPRFA